MKDLAFILMAGGMAVSAISIILILGEIQMKVRQIHKKLFEDEK